VAARRDYCQVLGVPRDADSKAIKDAFRRLARRYHPDTSTEPDARHGQVADQPHDAGLRLAVCHSGDLDDLAAGICSQNGSGTGQIRGYLVQAHQQRWVEPPAR
jgi:hypothetical protein